MKDFALIRPPGSWTNTERLFSDAIEHPWYQLLFQLYSGVFQSTVDFFSAKSFSPVLSPITTGAVSSPMSKGSDSLPVQIELFGRPTYLADSMQFHLEYLLRHNHSGVYYIMPSFRGEPSDERHLNQFYHAEVEIVGEIEDVISLVEEYINFLVTSILNNYSKLVYKSTGSLEHLEKRVAENNRIPRVSYIEALAYLYPNSYKNQSFHGYAISAKDEKQLLQYFGEPVWLTDLPANLVPFYQARNPATQNSAKAADLLMGIGEVVGCGERGLTVEEVNDSLNFQGIKATEYSWYLRMKKEYPLKTSGFGMGLERFLLWVLQHDDIRDMQLMLRLREVDGTP